MQLARAAKFGLALSLAAVAGLTTMEVVAKPKPPPVVEAPPPPPPMPTAGLSSRLVAQAAAYESYMRQASAISPAFTDAGGVASSLKVGVAYEPGQFRHGAVAYAAIAVLSDPAFVASVRAAGATPESRYQIVARIFANPASALAFADGRVAAGIAKQALIVPGRRLLDQGNAVRQAAYDIQHQPWSLADVAARDQRKDAVKALSASPRVPTQEETAALQRLVAGDAPVGGPADPAPPPYSPLVVHAVALAALAAIGQAGDDATQRVDWLTDDYFTDHCLAEAKLALYECLAVAKPNYEDVFCLGQHAMKDTGACVVRGGGGVVPVEIATEPLKIPRAHIRAHHVRRRHG